MSLFQWIADRFPTERMGGSPLLAAIWRVLFYALQPGRPFVMRTRDYRLRAHPRKGTLTRAVIRRGYWEPGVTAAFIKRLTPGTVVLDVGANFGHFALTAAGKVGPEGRVVAFEPAPRTFALLADNVALNGGGVLKAEPLAVSDAPGRLELAIDADNAGGHSLSAANISRGSERVMVEVVTIDAYVSEHLEGRRVGVIKIDVQGFEEHVLRGARAVIARDRPSILCEICPPMLPPAGSTVAGVFALLDGYDAALLSDDAPPQPMAFAEAIRRLDGGEAQYLDFLFTPRAAS